MQYTKHRMIDFNNKTNQIENCFKCNTVFKGDTDKHLLVHVSMPSCDASVFISNVVNGVASISLDVSKRNSITNVSVRSIRISIIKVTICGDF